MSATGTIFRSRPMGDIKEVKMLSAEGQHFGLNLWREMANFPVEEDGTIHAIDTQTRWNRYHNMH